MADLPDELTKLLSIPGNDTCMECNSNNVEWASINLGIFLCESCSGRHRTLGTHISQVRSLRLDTKIWTKHIIAEFKSKGNANAKSIYEHCVPLYAIKPPKDRGPLVTENWIRDKYERRLYTNPGNKNEDDSKSETQTITNSNLATHKMPCSPLSSILAWIIPNENEKYLTKQQFVVLHGRFLSRYNNASSQKCEQIIDITKCECFIEESELNEPCILNVESMKFEFETFEQIKFWTECIRRSALYYTQLAQHLCAQRANDTIHSLLTCEISDLGNDAIFRHLAYANMKKQGKFSRGYDKKWWSLNLQRNILLFFHRDPRTIKANKKNPLFVEAQGGFYLNEIIADIDDQIRSAQKHCLLIYHFDKSIFLKFEERWPLIEFWKSLHVKGKDVLFNNGDSIKYYEKTLNQQNMDYQVHILQQAKQQRMSKDTQHTKTKQSEFDLHSDDSQSPPPPKSFNPTESINGGGIGTAILNHAMLIEESVNFTEFAKDNPKEQRVSITEFNNQSDLLQIMKKKRVIKRQVSNVELLMDLSDVQNNANLSDDDDEEYDVQMDDEQRDSMTFTAMTTTMPLFKMNKESSMSREDSFNADFGIFDVEKSTNYSRFHRTHNIEINDSSPLKDFDQNNVTPIAEMKKEEEVQSPIVIKQSISSGQLSPTTAQDDELPEIKDNNIDSEEAIDNNLGHMRPPIGLTSMSALDFVADNAPNLPECDSPTLAAMTPDPSNEQLQQLQFEEIIQNHTSMEQNISVDTNSSAIFGTELDVDVDKVPILSPTLTDDGYLSEEESMMYKDHRRGTIEQYVEKNAYKSRTYRNFAQVTNPDFNKRIRQKQKKRSKKVELNKEKEEKQQKEDEHKVSGSRRSTKSLPCPPKRRKSGLELQRMYALNAVQVRKLNNSETMQFIMIQVGNMASFFVQPGADGHKLYIKLHGTQNDSNSSHKDTHEIWEYVEELLTEQIGRLRLVNME